MSQHVGNYKVIRKLGEGGMGVVYLAEHAVMGRLAAVKLLLPDMTESNDAVTRFFNEARATASIKHPGIVDIFDCAQLPSGQAYIVMEYLVGQTLGAYVARHGNLASDVEVARAILRQIANALSAAHARGIVHRDLKPDNVFLVSEAGATDTATIKVLDFGIAKLAKGHKPFAITTTRELLGTPVYVSPEQCKGAKNLDHRSDIYSLGCIAFEMITGRPVFVAESLGELIASHMYKDPSAIVDLEPGVPSALSELVQRMLAKSPDDRPSSMEEVIQAIDAAGLPAALRGGVVSLPPGRHLEVAPDDAAAATAAAPVDIGKYISQSKLAPAPAPASAPPAPAPAPIVEAPIVVVPLRRRALVITAGGAVAAAIAIIWFVAGGSSDHAAPVAAPQPASAVPNVAPPTPEPALSPTVVVDVEDPPARMTTRLDGKEVALPLVLPRGPGQHTLTFEAAGYEPVTRVLDGTKDRTIVLGMRPVSAPPAGTPSRPVKAAAKAPPDKAAEKTTGNAGAKRKTDLFLDL